MGRRERIRVPGNLTCKGTRETRLIRAGAELQCKFTVETGFKNSIGSSGSWDAPYTCPD